jgi:hypothetical protein
LLDFCTTSFIFSSVLNGPNKIEDWNKFRIKFVKKLPSNKTKQSQTKSNKIKLHLFIKISKFQIVKCPNNKPLLQMTTKSSQSTGKNSNLQKEDK